MRHQTPILLAGLLAGAAYADEPPPLVSAVPIPDGQVAAAIAQVDGLVAEVMARTGIPAIAVAVVADGGVALTRGYGTREAGSEAPVDADTVFQLASVSKSIGATVVAAEVSAGTVGWDTAMTELLPWFRLSDHTARH